MKHLFLLAFLGFTSLSFGQTTRSFPLNNFHSVDLSLPAEIHVEYGRDWRVEIEADEEAFDDLAVFVEAGELRIEREGGDWWEWIFSGNEERGLEIRIAMPEIRHLDIAGAAEIKVEGFSGGKLSIDVAGAAELMLNGTFDELICDLAGAGELTLTGGGRKLVLDIAGAAEVNARHYIADEVLVDAAGAIEAVVHARTRLVADISGAGELRYAGSPSEVKTDVSGTAEVEALD